MKKYDHKKIEKKWQEEWEKRSFLKIDKDDKSKEKYYVLDMFPYPSGTGLHMGHTESYTASDVYYRFKKMQGYNVLHPQGFDAFGLPAENFAIKTGVHPAETTQKNIDTYIKQMKSLGLAYDFNEKAVTSDPKYYKWTQWIFGKLYENGLVYKKTTKTNWCSSCQTVIANEQVVDSKCERCGTEIQQKEVPSWFFKITDFADDLIKDLDKVDWPEYTKKNQINWIGKSEGAKIKFKIKNSEKEIEVFTTRPDTLFGVTYMVLSPEHNLVVDFKDKISNWDEVEKYIIQTQNKTELDRLEAKEKTGVKLNGVVAINPANQEEIPVFIADYVLSSYGTGAIMAVPAHDERDFEFAEKYNLPKRDVVNTDSDILIDSGDFSGMESKKAKQKITEFVGGEMTSNYRLRDWSISRQRYWGCPIPIVYNKNEEEKIKKEAHQINFYEQSTWSRLVSGHKKVETRALNPEEPERYWGNIKEGQYLKAVNKKTNEERYFEIKKVWEFKNLEDFLTRPDLIEKCYSPNSPAKDLAKLESDYAYTPDYVERMNRNGLVAWEVEIINPGIKLIPEKYLPWLLPTDVDFVPTGVSPLAKSEELKKRTEEIFGKGWTPEYDTMDTFVDSSWYFLRYPDPHNENEFCSKDRLKHWLPVDLYIGGAEHTYMHLLFARFFVKAMNKIGLLDFDEPFLKLRHQGMVLDAKGKKMSKSKGNVINPDDMVARFGADSVRTYMLFAAPLEDEVMWNEDNIVGVYRFLEKVWEEAEKITDNKDVIGSDEVVRALHKTIKKVTEDVEGLKYNTAISEMMKFINMVKRSQISKKDLQDFLKLLAPFAPHITEELWHDLDNENSIHLEFWPKYDSTLVKDEVCSIALQVNGKVRDEVEVNVDISENDLKELVLSREKIKKWVADKEVKKVIFVKTRLVNIVI